ncbi:glycosyl transferase family 1 [Methanofervidicoccus sp. A16]|uniref:glycosyltransferase family 4 protein n=1 Tax=Methanofervidicoccus sp. A16 TaxID=2607662 RepID=UPI00118944B5|nr:glycosyltransferase family 1 protein [Methanofervidicoccus sp. A16]AXI24804.1 glycosyl transferase family 1 [Methanofervidicoccus sp. A16]
MKIGIISEPLNQSLTGVGNYTYNLIKELIKINSIKETTIYLINYNKIKIFNNLDNVIINNPFKNYPVKTYSWYIYLFMKFKVLPSSELSSLEIIHNPSQAPTYFKIKQQYVYTIHDLTPILFPNEHKNGKYLIYKLLLPKTLRTADKIIADSYNTKKDIIKYFKIPEDKIKVIHLGVDEKYKPLSEEEINSIKKKYSINYPFILYVGTLEPRKNIPTLIKAYYKLKKQGLPHKLVITGKKGWKYKSIFETIDKLNLQKDIIFTGYVPEEDLPALYNAADLFVYPSIYEGFGLPPLEAMACGTPVITSNTSSLPEVVGDAGIMVDPYDVDGLSKAMYEVLTNDGLREELRKKGLERAKLFSWKECAEEHLKVYEEVYNMR